MEMKNYQNQSLHRSILKTENSKQKLARFQLDIGLRLNIKQNCNQRFKSATFSRKEKTYETIQSNHDTNMTNRKSKQMLGSKRSSSWHGRLFKNASDVRLEQTYLKGSKKDNFQTPTKYRSHSQHKDKTLNQNQRQYFSKQNKLQLVIQNNNKLEKSISKQKISQRVKNLLSCLDRKQLKIGNHNKTPNIKQIGQRKLKLSSLQCNIQIELNRNNPYSKTQTIQKTILNTDQGYYQNKNWEASSNNKQSKLNNEKYEKAQNKSILNKTQVEKRKEHIAKGSLNDLLELVTQVHETESINKKLEYSKIRESDIRYKNQSLSISLDVNQSPTNLIYKQESQSKTKKQQAKPTKLVQQNQIAFNQKQKVDQSKKQLKLALNQIKTNDSQIVNQDTFRTLKTEGNFSDNKNAQKQSDRAQHINKANGKKNHVIHQKKNFNTPTNKMNNTGFSYGKVEQIDDIQQINLTLQSKVQYPNPKNQSKKDQEQYKVKVIESSQKRKTSDHLALKPQKNETTASKKQIKQVVNQKKDLSSVKSSNINVQNQTKTPTNITPKYKDIQSQKNINIEDLKAKIILLNDRITLITPIGQVAGYCSQLMKKSKLNWHLPALLLYKECYRQFTSVQTTYKLGFQQGLISKEQYQTFVSENQMILSNLEKIKKSAEKKDKIPSNYSQLVDPKNKLQLYGVIYKQVINFSKEFLKSEDAKDDKIAQCTLRMLDAACILLKLEGAKYKLAKTIQSMNPQQMNQLIPILLQFVQKKSVGKF